MSGAGPVCSEQLAPPTSPNSFEDEPGRRAAAKLLTALININAEQSPLATSCFHGELETGMFRLFGALAALTALTVLVPATSLVAQSFNCRYAKTPDEVAICDNSSLAEMDVKMSNLYFGYRNFYHGPARRRLEADQAAWLKTRLDCGRNFICKGL
jgi:uncharacterized protein YecT (DUF1311 family)